MTIEEEEEAFEAYMAVFFEGDGSDAQEELSDDAIFARVDAIRRRVNRLLHGVDTPERLGTDGKAMVPCPHCGTALTASVAAELELEPA